MRRRFHGLAALLLATSLQFGTVQAAETLVVGQAGDTLTLDPLANPGIVEASFASNFFEGLIAFDKDMKIIPALATKWEVAAPDRWIFHLRPGVKFHDGSTLTAEDVKYSLDRMKNWKPYGGHSGIAVYISGVKSVEVIDPLTVQINTNGPFGPLLRNLRAAYIMNKAYTERLTSEKGIEEVGRSPMGTGPFKFVDWTPGDRMMMERFDGYWGEKAGVERVLFRQIANNATRTAALLSGEIHIATELPPHDVKRVESGSSTKVEILDGMRTVNFKFDTIRKQTPGIPGIDNPLRDVRVRKAINHAVDSKAIAKVVMNGFAKPSTQLAGRQHFGWSPNIERLPYDPAKAKALLTEAGYPNGFPIRVDSTNNRYVNDEQICLAVAQMLTRAGLQANCRARSKQIAFKEFHDENIQCCSMFIFSFVTPTADIAGNMEANFHTPTADGLMGAGNGRRPEKAYFSNKEADRLIGEAAKIVDEKEREKVLQKASEVIMKDYPIVPLHYQNDIYGMSKKVIWNPRPDYYMTMVDAKLSD